MVAIELMVAWLARRLVVILIGKLVDSSQIAASASVTGQQLPPQNLFVLIHARLIRCRSILSLVAEILSLLRLQLGRLLQLLLFDLLSLHIDLPPDERLLKCEKSERI